jgi:hypothetical protein
LNRVDGWHTWPLRLSQGSSRATLLQNKPPFFLFDNLEPTFYALLPAVAHLLVDTSQLPVGRLNITPDLSQNKGPRKTLRHYDEFEVMPHRVGCQLGVDDRFYPFW